MWRGCRPFRMRAGGGGGGIAVVCDSTNALREGSSGSEGELRQSLTDLIGRYQGRVAVACFASNVARLQTVSDAGGWGRRGDRGGLRLDQRIARRQLRFRRRTEAIADRPYRPLPGAGRSRLLCLECGAAADRFGCGRVGEEGGSRWFATRPTHCAKAAQVPKEN